ncbi:MAG: hypothetical protein PWQ41_1426 [Bacillota bacterium]|jgi:hypothetical protein|nr:hypothetical protein [Bacillota bacterium]MDK2856637.1 hypothetical protein [Bacillota bacterium]MDK2925652.1 hypothetical protein [Bacillota bacterium]
MNERLAQSLRNALIKAGALAAGFFKPGTPAQTEFDLPAEVEAAKADWVAARRYFDAVTDPDLIDFAIYNMEAAQRRYTYLLKRARAEGARVQAT